MNSREILAKDRSYYFASMLKAEKAEMMQNLEDESTRIELASLNFNEMKLNADKACEKYFASSAEEKKL